MKKMTSFFLMTFLQAYLYAAMSSQIVIEGKVGDFNAKRVTLIYDNGKRVSVPRTAIPKHFEIRPGYDVSAFMSSDSLAKEVAKAKK